MQVKRLLLLSLSVASLLLAASCASSTPPTASPSAHASVSPSAGAATPVSITLSTTTVKIGGTITITGSGFSAGLTTVVNVVQNGKTNSLVATTVDVRPDGTFILPAAIPSNKGLVPGPAAISACSFNPKGVSAPQCSSHPITLTA
jgi:ABC-type phosphate transport system substrate-binding protein